MQHVKEDFNVVDAGIVVDVNEKKEKQMNRAEIAIKNKKNGMNCAQAVACAFEDIVDVDQETLMAMTQGFGVGIGASVEGTCGAIVGATLILGLVEKEGRAKAMQKAKTLLTTFQTQNQSVICKELKGIETGVVLRACNDCVGDAAQILENILEESV